MNNKLKNAGFSLTEVLLAVGTLAIGMIFIAGTFLAGTYFTTIATERTIAAVAADEAFAKVRLYGLDVNQPSLTTGQLTAFSALTPISGDELMYPSTAAPMSEKQYCWAALCRRANQNSSLVQVTVLVSRKVGASAEYWGRQGSTGWPNLERLSFPRPIPVGVMQDPSVDRADELRIIDAVSDDPVDERAFVNDGYTIVDDQTGQIYRVLERKADQPDKIVLDRPWQAAIAPPMSGWVWVVPPPISGGKSPCVAIYQNVIRF
jgi:Tfp pilus assembly protein PilV